jgi:hypothetical protein
VESIDLSVVVGISGIPIVTALVQLLKLTFPQLDSRWWPALSFGVAVLLNVGAAAVLRSSIETGVIWGVLAGLSASGLYTWTRSRTAAQ